MATERTEPWKFWRHVDRAESHQCWPWTASLGRGGYGTFKSTNAAGVAKNITAHRHAKSLAIERPLLRSEICRHVCDNPLCCNPDHLLIGTQAENVADRVARQRSATGERNGQSRLTNEQAEMVRSSSLGLRTLARLLGVHHSTVSRVRRGLQHQRPQQQEKPHDR